MIERPSPNFDDRKDGAVPSILVMHYTNMKTAEEAIARMCDAKSKVSAHYCIDEDGSVCKLVDEDKRAWHAGQSFWQGETDINSHSIGIELVNPGHDHGYREFPYEQIGALVTLCKDIQGRRAIKHVLAHSDIAPGRKEDPGHLFPWEYLAKQGIGLWPPEESGAGEPAELLAAIGYDPGIDLTVLVRAFQRHYVPEVFEGGTDGMTGKRTMARLLGLHKALHS